jgi:hypothetical protein
VTGCIEIVKRLKKSATELLTKLKYLNTNKTPKHATIVPAKIPFFFLQLSASSKNLPALYESTVVKRIKKTYFGFQLM